MKKLLFGSKAKVLELPELPEIAITRGGPSNIAGYAYRKGVNSVNDWMEYATKLVVQTEIRKKQIFQVHIGVQKATWYGSKRVSRPIFFAWENIEGFTVDPGISSNNSFLQSIWRYNRPTSYYGVTNHNSRKNGKYCVVGNEEFPFGDIENENDFDISGNLYVWVMARGEGLDMADYVNLNFYDYPCAKVILDYHCHKR